MLRTIRRKWKAIFAAACGLIGVLVLIHEGYRVLVFGRIHPIPGLASLYRLYCRLAADSSCVNISSTEISWDAHPILFVVTIAFLLPGLAVMAALAAMVVWEWRTRKRILDRRDSRPPIECGIRESVER
jgi:hypothetical protein